MGLGNGTDEFWNFREQAERIYEKIVDADSITEKRRWAECAHDLADRMVELYGFDDPDVNRLIDRYYLRWKY